VYRQFPGDPAATFKTTPTLEASKAGQIASAALADSSTATSTVGSADHLGAGDRYCPGSTSDRLYVPSVVSVTNSTTSLFENVSQQSRGCGFAIGTRHSKDGNAAGTISENSIFSTAPATREYPGWGRRASEIREPRLLLRLRHHLARAANIWWRYQFGNIQTDNFSHPFCQPDVFRMDIVGAVCNNPAGTQVAVASNILPRW